MFYEGETIRSRYHGFGEVTVSGTRPLVRFLCGWECYVDGDTIRYVSRDDFDAELLNIALIEQYLSLRVYGCDFGQRELLPKPRFDLVAAMLQQAKLPPIPGSNSTISGHTDFPCK